MSEQQRRLKKPTYSLFIYWLLSHCRAFLFALGQLIQAPISNVMTILVIGIAIALPTGLYVVLQNFSELNKNWDYVPSISLYLKNDITQTQKNNLMLALEKTPEIDHHKFISPQEGLKEFSQFTQFKDITNYLNTNPLPGVIIIYLKSNQPSLTTLNHLLQRFQNYPGVDLAKTDRQWAKRLSDIVILGKRVTNVLGIIFSIGVILIISNTIRLALEDHIQEIQILKLIGATHAFIRRPLVYRGFLYGLLGGVIAWILLLITLTWLAPPATDLAKSYGHALIIHGLSAKTEVAIIGLSSLLGLIGAFIAITKHLRASKI